MVAILLAAALVAMPVSNGDQFDLKCSGEQKMIGFGIADGIKPFHIHLRLDLAAKRYCSGECPSTRAISDVQPNVIVLLSRNPSGGIRRELAESEIINRVSGTYRGYLSDPRYGDIDSTAVCAKEPFSGFPVMPTKF